MNREFNDFPFRRLLKLIVPWVCPGITVFFRTFVEARTVHKYFLDHITMRGTAEAESLVAQ
jgi:hypothetical protein